MTNGETNEIKCLICGEPIDIDYEAAPFHIYVTGIGCYNYDCKMFGKLAMGYGLSKKSAKRAVLKKWDKLTQKADDRLKVGDEIIDGGIKCVVVRVDDRINYVASTGKIYSLDSRTHKAWAERQRTGRHFPQIAEVLETMSGG